MDNFIKILGHKIRVLRLEKKIMLKELAEKVHVTPSLISQIERGLANPSISSLKAISDVLNVSMAELLDTNSSSEIDSSPVFKTGTHKTVITGSGNKVSLLNPGKMDVEIILSEFPPGSSTGEMEYRHSGLECAVVIEGELNVELEDKEYVLRPGDSIVFDSASQHRISNVGDKPAKAIWVNSIPWIFPR